MTNASRSIIFVSIIKNTQHFHDSYFYSLCAICVLVCVCVSVCVYMCVCMNVCKSVRAWAYLWLCVLIHRWNFRNNYNDTHKLVRAFKSMMRLMTVTISWCNFCRVFNTICDKDFIVIIKFAMFLSSLYN